MQTAQANHPQTRRRIVMAGPLPPAVGGMATVIDDISRSSLAQQVELVLFGTTKKTPPGRSLCQAIATRLSIWQDWWRLLEPQHQTIAHVHTCSGLTFFLDGALILIARLKGVQTVLHIHGGKFDQFLDALPGPLQWLARWFARRADRVVVLSPEWQGKLASRLPGARLFIIPNGVAALPAKTSVNKFGEIMVLFLGGLGKGKGVWDLIAVMANLDPRCHLVLIGGEGDPGIVAALEPEIYRLGIESRVHIIGPAVGEAKFRWLNGADIFVLPSYAEGVPISMLEAMAAGLPVVVTPVGGIGSVISDNKNGLLVEPGNQTQLCNAIQSLANDAALRQRLGDQAKADCLENFGVEKSVAAYLKLYDELMLFKKSNVSPHLGHSHIDSKS